MSCYSNSDKPSGVEGFPLRRWSIQIVLLNEHGEEVPATIFEKATYKLHPSFNERQIQSEILPQITPMCPPTSIVRANLNPRASN